jgi:hypothetical protein
MKTSRILITLLILLSLVPQAFAPVPAEGPQIDVVQAGSKITIVEFTVINNTGKLVGIVMEGTSRTGVDKLYKFMGYTGKSVYRIESGVYVTTFYGCGREAAKKLQMKSSRRVTLKCGDKNNDPNDRITIK